MSEEWRKKLRGLCDGLGVAGDAVYNEIEDAIEDDIYEKKDAAYFEGMRVGEQQARGSDN